MKIRIEMEVPDSMDPSEILERMQEVAVEFAQTHGEDQDEESDDYDECAYLMGDGHLMTTEEIENEVSVEPIEETAEKAA